MNEPHVNDTAPPAVVTTFPCEEQRLCVLDRIEYCISRWENTCGCVESTHSCVLFTSMHWMIITLLDGVQICLSILNPYSHTTHCHMKTHKESITSFINGRVFFALCGKCCFAVKSPLFSRLAFVGTAPNYTLQPMTHIKITHTKNWLKLRKMLIINFSMSYRQNEARAAHNT